MAALKRYSWDDPEERVLSVVSGVEELHHTGLHTDCVLVGGGARIRCHTVMLASVSRVFRDILPQPGEEREDTVIILADWEEEDVRSAVTMLYCGALAYRAGARDKVGRVAALLESVGVQGFEEEVVDMEQKDEQSNANLVGLQIMDIRTIPTEELKTEVISEHDQLADGDPVLCGDIRQPDATVTVSSSGENGRYQCFRCGGEFSSKPEYKLHLEEHIKDTKKCISKLKVNLKEGVKNTDWMCESCYIILLNDGDNEQECWNILNMHQKSCIEEVDKEIKKIMSDSDKIQNQDQLVTTEDIPKCEKCGKEFRLSIQLKKHKKSCTGLDQIVPSVTSSSLLSILTAKDRAECPSCKLNIDPENMDWHLLSSLSHGIRNHLEADTPEEEEYKCSDSRCALTWGPDMRLSYIVHKYVNCKHTARNSIDSVLERLTMADIQVVPGMEEDSTSDKENNGVMEVCSNEEKNNPNCHVPSEGSSVLGSVKKQVLTSKKRTTSGRGSSGDEVVSSEAGRKKSRDTSPETSPLSLKCPQCLRVFRDTREFQNSNKHLCVVVGKLREPLEEEKNPTASMLVTHKCNICVGGPVLVSDLQYLKHLSLAHKGIFIMNQLKKQALESKLHIRESGEGPCCWCSKQLSGWEEAVIHVAIDHEKLFQALKHDKNNDYKILMKRFFPDKYKKWSRKSKINKIDIESNIQEDPNLETSMDTGIASMDVNSSMDTQADLPHHIKGTKRKLVTEHIEEQELGIKIPRESVTESTGASEEDTTRPTTPKSPRSCQCKNCQLPDCRQCRFCQDRLAYGGEGKLRQRCEKRICLMGKGKGKLSVPKERLTCMICPSKSTKSYSNQTNLKQHMADAHFSEYILTHYPHPINSTSISYPCAFPNCSKILNSGPLRVKHLGAVHNQVDLCLAMPKLVEKAKEVAGTLSEKKKQRPRIGQLRVRRSVSQDSDSLTCKTCNSSFATRESLKLHTCHSLMDKSELQCMDELNRAKRTRRPSNQGSEDQTLSATLAQEAPPALNTYDCCDSPVEVHGPAPSVLDIYDYVDSSEVQSPVADPIAPCQEICDFVPSPVTSKELQASADDLGPVTPVPTTQDTPVTSTSNTPTKLQLMLSDSESGEDEPLSHVAKIRDKMKLLCTSDDDSDDDEESVPLDNLDPSDSPTPPGMVFEETVQPVPPHSCNICHKTFGSNADVEKHQQCVKCFPGNESFAIETCEKHTTCEYCHKCYNKGVDVHVTCDAVKCKKCFSSEKEKREHFSKTHSWDDM